MVDEMLIQIIVERLQNIAKINERDFSYRIHIFYEPEGTVITGRMMVAYGFVVTDDADDHVFVSGDGLTIRAAVQECIDKLDEACHYWGYKED